MYLPKIFFGCIVLSYVLIPTYCYGVKVLAIPGMNGGGSDAKYVKRILEVPKADIITVQTPRWLPDLGQQRCMKLLDEVVKKGGNEDYLIHATSQGGATALNYTALHDKGVHIKGMILEAPLVHGNSAIHHTMQGPLAAPFSAIGKLPFSYYWLPYATKLIYPFYRPGGTQAIHSVKDIPKDMPIIIIHALEDPQISIDDASALYHALRKTGHNNVYFLRVYSNDHLYIIKRDDDKLKNQIHTILKKHGLLHVDRQINTSDIQPDYMQYEKHYRNLMDKEKNHWLFRRFLTLGGCLGLISFAGWQMVKDGSALMRGWQHEI